MSFTPLPRFVASVNETACMCLILSTSVKKNIRLNPSDLVDKLAMFISGQIEEKRRLGMKLKDVIEKGYDEYKTANRPRITNLKEIAPKQCCHYDGETKYSTKFQRWVNTKSVIVICRFIVNLSITKFSIVMGSPRAYSSRNRHAIPWVSNYRYPI